MNNSTLTSMISKVVAALSAALLPANFAFAAAANERGSIISLFPYILIMVILWALLIRPQQKRMKEHAEKIQGIKKGNKVVTGGGILGRVTNIKDGIATIEIAEGVSIKVKQDTITDLQEKPEPKAKKERNVGKTDKSAK